MRDAMTDTSRLLLRELLVEGYGDLRMRLTKRLGSVDQAEEAIQDTWLQLETVSPAGTLRHPQSYLFQIAYHIALRAKRKTQRNISLEEMRDVLEIPYDTPSPEAAIDAKSSVLRLQDAVAQLTRRQRVVLLAHRLHGTTVPALAKRLGVSQRTVERDLQNAVLHCVGALNKKSVINGGSRPARSSQNYNAD
jgi:RNA polymerase sigma-70 factor (ECF subfamily)